MNVVGSRPDGWWRDRQAATGDLVERLGGFARSEGTQVTVVFDGEAPDDPPRAEGVEVRFAPGGPDSADDVIAELVEADAKPEDLVVVTSDDALAERVRAHGGQVVGAGTFRRRLD